MRRYHYTVRMISWTHSKKDYEKFRRWAQDQESFWWNHLGGNYAIFSFWAYPNIINDLLEQQGWYTHALSIDVGVGALPEEER